VKIFEFRFWIFDLGVVKSLRSFGQMQNIAGLLVGHAGGISAVEHPIIRQQRARIRRGLHGKTGRASHKNKGLGVGLFGWLRGIAGRGCRLVVNTAGQKTAGKRCDKNVLYFHNWRAFLPWRDNSPTGENGKPPVLCTPPNPKATPPYLQNRSEVRCGEKVACELADVFWQPPLPYPSPPRRRRGKNSGGRVTQGCARSSLTLGYSHVIPTEFQFGATESRRVSRKLRGL